MYTRYKLIVPEHLKSVYSTWEQANEINKILKKYISKKAIVTDATACIGGNSIFLLRDFKSVNSVEKDKDTFYTLKKNTNFPNCKHYNCSYLHLMYVLKQDLIFLDPPWGGTDYKNTSNIDLFLDNVNVLNVIDNLYHYTRYIAMKIPKNYNLISVDKNFWDWKIYPIHSNKKNKFNLIVFYKKI
jgi:16S rRNA G966 N2-methylase RsmD